MKIYCPDCGNQVPASDIDVHTGLAKCARCNSVFDFEQRRQITAPATNILPDASLELIPHPPQITVQELGKDWELRWRWFGATYIGMAVFCVAWDAFLIFWYTVAIRGDNTPWIAIIFPIGHLAVGIGLTYATIAGFLNSTSVRRSGFEFVVQHSPVPWPGNRRLAISDIAQIYCELSQNNRWNQNRQFNNYRSYSLSAVMRNGQRVQLLSGQPAEYVKFLENEIERRLGLQNRPVAGEVVPV